MHVRNIIEKALRYYETEGQTALKRFIYSLTKEQKQQLKRALSVRSLKAAVFKIKEFSHSIKMG